MIHRLVTTLDALARPGADGAGARRLRADCADALRLELDCPQQDLTPSQRATLRRLEDALDGPAPLADVLARLVREARIAVGLPERPPDG